MVIKLSEMTDHRPWPLPGAPWVQEQTWNDVLFAHWPLPPQVLRPMIPEGLELETYDGSAWLGITPLFMTGVKIRGLPSIPFASQFPELNVRTYVRVGDKPGVFFFSLDAANSLVVTAARELFLLPYYRAEISVTTDSALVIFNSRRTDSKGLPAEFMASYGPISKVFHAEPNSFDRWLTERYCLYTVDPSGLIYRCEIHHLPWPLQRAEAQFGVNTMAQSHGLQLPEDQIMPLHYARRLDVLVWGLERVK